MEPNATPRTAPQAQDQWADVNGVRLRYRVEGPEGAPWLTLSNSLGTDLTMWSAQAEALSPYFRLLRYDTRGHGQSSAPQGPYAIEQLRDDVIALWDHLGIARSHFCGISMGGLTGLALGIEHPDRLDKLVLSNTAARVGSEASWQTRIDTVQEKTLAGFADTILSRWFTEGFQTAHPEKLVPLRAVLTTTSEAGYCANCGALASADLRDAAASVSVPTLVIAGTHDLSTSAEQGRWLHAQIPGARYKEFAAGHIANVEKADAYSQTLLDFFDRGALQEKTRYQKGLAVRREVLGAAHVDRSLQHLTPFNEEFQDMITRYAWGGIWTRDGLPRHTRSLLTIGLMIALNRNEELALHLRAARNNGVTREEVKEVLLQCAIYCGVPAANSAFHLAETIWQEQDKAQNG
ncbi:3-oxoadipate enol-lactonase [Robbsia sp. KACC 23696]|uniref:bifunctional 3-oxoadipate enol-lactonase/4-carboxymuconolactone decarboxylase PcaDC n=1 Tax=Robbsia sp. KACC 23696 TaxID=3149231 RepID=UPI00325BA016